MKAHIFLGWSDKLLRSRIHWTIFWGGEECFSMFFGMEIYLTFK